MELIVSEDFTLYHRNGSFPKGTIIYVEGIPEITPIINFSEETDVSEIRPTKWILEQEPEALCIWKDIVWYNRGYSPPKNPGVKLTHLSKEKQEFIIRHRPDFIGQIQNLDPELKRKYKHELDLSKIDI